MALQTGKILYNHFRILSLPFITLGFLFSSACHGEPVTFKSDDSNPPIPMIEESTATLEPTETTPPTLTETQLPPTTTATLYKTPEPTPTVTPIPTSTAASLGEAVIHLDTPEKLGDFLINEIEFSEHGGCISYWPDVFFQKRQGNCKDYSTFASYVLGQNGYEGQRIVYIFYRNGVQYGHEVASYKMDGELWIMSNGVIDGPFGSLSDYFDSLTWLDYPTLLCIKPPGGVTCCRP
jgi:hypothetical protein